MPELPEVETVRRGLDAVLPGKRITRARVSRYDLRVPVPGNLVDILTGNAVVRTARRGKYILLLLESEQVAVLHLGMSGRVHILAPGQAYAPQKHDHIVWETEDGTTIVFNDPRRFGMAYLADADAWERED